MRIQQFYQITTPSATVHMVHKRGDRVSCESPQSSCMTHRACATPHVHAEEDSSSFALCKRQDVVYTRSHVALSVCLSVQPIDLRLGLFQQDIVGYSVLTEAGLRSSLSWKLNLAWNRLAARWSLVSCRYCLGHLKTSADRLISRASGCSLLSP